MWVLVLSIIGALYLAASVLPHFVARRCYLGGGRRLRVVAALLQAFCVGWLALLYLAARPGGEDWYGWQEQTTLVCQFLAVPVVTALVHLFVRYHQRFHLRQLDGGTRRRS